MNTWIKAILILGLLLFLLPETAACAPFDETEAGACFFVETETGTYKVKKETEFLSHFTDVQKAAMVFEQLLNGVTPESGLVTYIPAETVLLNVTMAGDLLVVDVSAKINACGGTYWQKKLVEQLVETAFSLEGVNYFTLLIEGETAELSEGIHLQELKKE